MDTTKGRTSLFELIQILKVTHLGQILKNCIEDHQIIMQCVMVWIPWTLYGDAVNNSQLRISLILSKWSKKLSLSCNGGTYVYMYMEILNYCLHSCRYHLDCLTPPLNEIPEGDWYCPSCAIVVNSQYTNSPVLSDEGSMIVINLDLSTSESSDSDSNGSFEVQWRSRKAGVQLQFLRSSSESAEEEEENEEANSMQLMQRRRARRLSSSESDGGSDSDSDSVVQLLITRRKRSVARPTQIDSEGEDEDENETMLDDQQVLCSPRDSQNGSVGICAPFSLDLSDYNSDYTSQDYAETDVSQEGTFHREMSASNGGVYNSMNGSSSFAPKYGQKKLATPSLLGYSLAQQIPSLDIEMASKVRSASTKGKQPASSQKQRIVKNISSSQSRTESLLSDDDDSSICSGYGSPKQSRGEVIPASTALQDSDFEDEIGPSKSVTRRDGGRAKMDAKEKREPRTRAEDPTLESLPDGFKEKVIGATSSKGSLAKPTRKRRRPVKRKAPLSKKQTRKSKKRMKRSRRGRNRAKRRFAAAYHPSNDPTYVPPYGNFGSFPSPRLRRSRLTRARTVATHSPLNQNFRAAVIEAHKHTDTSEGLEKARAVLKQRSESPHNAYVLAGTSYAASPRNFTTPQSGYNTPVAASRAAFGKTQVLATPTGAHSPVLRDRPLGNSPLLECYKKPSDRDSYSSSEEVARRTVPKRKLSALIGSPLRSVESPKKEASSVSRQ